MAAGDVTTLLRAWGDGDRSAGEQLFPLIYEELRRLAGRQGSFDADHTLHATALVHEAFIEFNQGLKSDWRDRAQFFAFAALVMRRLMVDYQRAKRADKRGGSMERIEFDEALHALLPATIDFEILDDALTRLAQLDQTQARVVEMRFFGGMTVVETAEYLGISVRTVNRQWGMAKVWLADNVKP